MFPYLIERMVYMCVRARMYRPMYRLHKVNIVAFNDENDDVGDGGSDDDFMWR